MHHEGNLQEVLYIDCVIDLRFLERFNCENKVEVSIKYIFNK